MYVLHGRCTVVGLLGAQIEAGQGVISGMCCQKVVEAEAMVEGGIHDVFLANEVIGEDKALRLAALAAAPHHAAVSVVVDSELGVQQLQAAAKARQVVLGVLVEVDVGQARCGVADAAAVVALAQHVASASHLRFVGVQAYHGAAQHIRHWTQRAETIKGVVDIATSCVTALQEAGLVSADLSLPPYTPPEGVLASCSIPPDTTLRVTGAGTGTFPLEAASGVFTELQPGSFIFNDVDYARNEAWVSGTHLPHFPSATAAIDSALAAVPVQSQAALLGEGAEKSLGVGEAPGSGEEWGQLWEHSLFLLATVMSRNVQGGYAVLDCGMKALSVDSGQPVLARSVASARRAGASGAGAVFGVTTDEHSTVLAVDAEGKRLAGQAAEEVLPELGSKVLLVPSHCDPTVNLHDFIVLFTCPAEASDPMASQVQSVVQVQARSPGY